jgi:hypothetical protein
MEKVLKTSHVVASAFAKLRTIRICSVILLLYQSKSLWGCVSHVAHRIG